jgi:hypothetical protein
LRSRVAAGVVAIGVAWGGCATWAQPASGMDELVSSLQVQVEDSDIRLTLHVTNFTAVPLVLEFMTGQRHDFDVYQAGQLVWRWSADRFFTQALGSEEIGPGETRSYEARWQAEGRSGVFEAAGRVTAANRSIEQRAEFRIP